MILQTKSDRHRGNSIVVRQMFGPEVDPVRIGVPAQSLRSDDCRIPFATMCCGQCPLQKNSDSNMTATATCDEQILPTLYTCHGGKSRFFRCSYCKSLCIPEAIRSIAIAASQLIVRWETLNPVIHNRSGQAFRMGT